VLTHCNDFIFPLNWGFWLSIALGPLKFYLTGVARPPISSIHLRGADMKYRVTIEKTEEGYAIWVPGLPGCWSQGGSEDEALENIKDAIKVYLVTVDTITADKETRYVEVVNA